MKAIFFLSVIITNTVAVIAQSGYLDGKFPLDSGNVWVYYGYSYGFDPYDFGNETITIDTIQYNIIYHRMTGTPMYLRLRDDGYFVQRLDSSSINEPNNEQIFYKKNAVIGDSWTNTFGTTNYTSVVTDTFPAYIFDTVVVGKNIYIDAYLNIFNQVWTEEFGLLYVEDFYGPLCYLAGCIINGRLYGDTSATLVEYEPLTILPKNLELLQNYPNPFNPITNIEYVLPKESYVNLAVYNSLGEEIAVLVNEYQRSGKYKVQFSTSEINNLSSGVYFYSLKTGNNIKTKKMVFLR